MNKSAVIAHICNWMKEYSTNSKTKGFVVGVSGGIDSALTSTLAAETGLEVLLVEMPIHQEISQVSRAQEHINFLQNKYSNVRSTRVELSESFDLMVKAFGNSDLASRELALVNTRARIRMTTLYYFAQLNNLIVAGTGNKIEDFGIGFFTKYGDGGVDISPIADLLKSEVYSLARELGVSDSILTAPPTDGLWGDDKTDEDQIGASYDELEWAMEFAGRYGEDTNRVNSLSERQRTVLEIYKRLNKINQHKMLPIPVCTIPTHLK